VATWGDGLFAVTGDGRTQEIANQPVRGLAPDGRGGALAIVGAPAAVVVCLFTNQNAKVEILGEDLSSNSRAAIVF
jgi:hypothetical protein